MATFLDDTFTEASGSPELNSHTGETGATWTKHGSSSVGTMIVPAAIDRLRADGGANSPLYYASGSPASADYEVSGTFLYLSSVAATTLAVCGRMDTGANTFYYLIWVESSARWELRKLVAGTSTTLGNFPQTLVASTSYLGTLRMVGTAIEALIDGVSRIGPITDSAISAAGKAGVRCAQASAFSNTTAVHLDSITAVDVGSVAVVRRLALTGVGV